MLLFVSALFCLGLAVASPVETSNELEVRATASTTCAQIAKQISSSSAVYYPTSLNFQTDLKHWMMSSMQTSTCVVEVGSTADTAIVMKLIGASKTPFAVKSGGHASNPGFSSTPGVHISLTRLNSVTLSTNKKTAVVGLGNTWIDVYKALDGSGVNLVGGRVAGPGTGGFTLGGGYSWLTNQYGLTCDQVQSYTLVLPNGTVTQVGAAQKDLFFALKGGLNRFGVATFITYKTVPQVPLVYGGYTIYAATALPALINATEQFQKYNTDPKAQVIMTLNSGIVAPNVTETAILLSFFDGPTKPPSFSYFDGIPYLANNVSTQSFVSFAQAAPSQDAGPVRGAFHTLSTTTLTQNFMNAVFNQSQYYSQLALVRSASLLSFDLEPFGTDYGQHATDSAFPHHNSPLPLNLYWSWDLAAEDDYWRGKMAECIDYLNGVAKAEGIHSANQYAYPNYALASYTGDQLYGPKNAARLRTIQKQVDPHSIMQLAGGFTI